MQNTANLTGFYILELFFLSKSFEKRDLSKSVG